jgi:hypothetical protein
VLFFHEQVQLVQAIERIAIFFLVIFEWLQQANDGYAAFVFDDIAHSAGWLRCKNIKLHLLLLVLLPVSIEILAG